MRLKQRGLAVEIVENLAFPRLNGESFRTARGEKKRVRRRLRVATAKRDVRRIDLFQFVGVDGNKREVGRHISVVGAPNDLSGERLLNAVRPEVDGRGRVLSDDVIVRRNVRETVFHPVESTGTARAGDVDAAGRRENVVERILGATEVVAERGSGYNGEKNE